jgi:hypothetical protein
MATVVKNFRIKSGLVVEGATGTINGQNILTETGGNSYILNLVGGATLVKSVDSGTFAVDGAGNLTVKANVFDAYGSASSAQSAAMQQLLQQLQTQQLRLTQLNLQQLLQQQLMLLQRLTQPKQQQKQQQHLLFHLQYQQRFQIVTQQFLAQ